MKAAVEFLGPRQARVAGMPKVMRTVVELPAPRRARVVVDADRVAGMPRS